MNYTSTSIETNVAWRATPRDSDSKRAGRLSKSNVSPVGSGATNYGKIKAGTILARDSNGLLHPLGCAKVATAPSASNDIEVDNATNFYVGDLVSLRSGSDKTKSITNNSVVLSIVAKVHGLNLIIAVAGASTKLGSSYNPVNKTITVNSATDGGSAATSTHADIVGELYKFGQLIRSASSATPATTCAALATTALASAKYGAIASARSITAITGNTLTLSGATFTGAIDDLVVKDGAYIPVGILDETVSTTSYIDDTVVASDKTVAVAYEGDARASSSYVGNLCAGVAGTFVKRVLGGRSAVDAGVDPSTSYPTEVVPSEFVGFRFIDV